jgi:hypothetical protein
MDEIQILADQMIDSLLLMKEHNARERGIPYDFKTCQDQLLKMVMEANSMEEFERSVRQWILAPTILTI